VQCGGGGVRVNVVVRCSWARLGLSLDAGTVLSRGPYLFRPKWFLKQHQVTLREFKHLTHAFVFILKAAISIGAFPGMGHNGGAFESGQHSINVWLLHLRYHQIPSASWFIV
jgi:hypothetical protein